MRLVRPWMALTLAAVTLLCCGNPAASGPATGGSKALDVASAAAASDYDRESTPPVPEDPYETLPKLRYRLAPSAPVVSASAGAPGSGVIDISWKQTWLGRGDFSGFAIVVRGGGSLGALTVGADVRTEKLSGMAAGDYTITVSAMGQYADTVGNTVSVKLLPTPAPAVAPAPAGCGWLIDVGIAAESMTVYHCGAVVLTTPITSGRAGWPSPRGTFYIRNKLRNVWFRYTDPSCTYDAAHDCYPPQVVKYAFDFYGAYYLHTWYQPNLSYFGPGSQNGPYASLGCIEAPDGVMAQLYGELPIGTPIRIHN